VTAARILALGMALSVAQAASLKPETVKAWEDYVESASGGMRERANAPGGFLQIDATPAVAAKVHGGQIVVSPAASQIPRKVPSGLIHDWIGTAFLANKTIQDVVAIVRDYPKYTEVYAPHVLESRVISTGESGPVFGGVDQQVGALEDRAGLRLRNDVRPRRQPADVQRHAGETHPGDRRLRHSQPTHASRRRGHRTRLAAL